MFVTFRNAGAAGALVCVLTAAPGCTGKPSVAMTDNVEGTLTLDGTPLAGAHVEFIPDVGASVKAPSSGGTTDEKGFFRLTRNDNGKPGAAVCAHRVVVYPGRPDAKERDPGPSPVPAVYLNADKTPLRVEVKAGQSEYPVKLSRAGR
jgi:hypothetical protein